MIGDGTTISAACTTDAYIASYRLTSSAHRYWKVARLCWQLLPTVCPYTPTKTGVVPGVGLRSGVVPAQVHEGLFDSLGQEGLLTELAPLRIWKPSRNQIVSMA